MSDLTTDGERLVADWMSAQKRIESAVRELNGAQCAEMNARTALGRWLTPHDAKDGESFCVWRGDSLIRAEKKGEDYSLTIRSRGRNGYLNGVR